MLDLYYLEGVSVDFSLKGSQVISGSVGGATIGSWVLIEVHTFWHYGVLEGFIRGVYKFAAFKSWSMMVFRRIIYC